MAWHMVEELFEVDNQMGEQNEACEGSAQCLKNFCWEKGTIKGVARLSVQKGTLKGSIEKGPLLILLNSF